MGSDTTNPQTPTSGSSPSGKRSRDPEDDVYVDNLQTHKRYLSEMMASSLNGLTVGDAMPETIMDSPARSENMFYLRDEMSLQYSPMSEDFDDARYCETPMSACSSQSESRPTSPVSPYRYKPMGAFCCSPPSSPLTSNVCNVATGHLSQPRQRGSDTEGRFPSSPSDICHSSDLRKAALLRSVQMRAQPSCSSLYDIEYTAAQEPLQTIEGEPRPLDDLQEYHADNCSTLGSSEPGYPVQESLLNTETEKRSCSVMKPSDVEQEYHVEGCSPEPSFGVRKQSTQNIEDGSVENSFIYTKAPEV